MLIKFDLVATSKSATCLLTEDEEKGRASGRDGWLAQVPTDARTKFRGEVRHHYNQMSIECDNACNQSVPGANQAEAETQRPFLISCSTTPRTYQIEHPSVTLAVPAYDDDTDAASAKVPNSQQIDTARTTRAKVDAWMAAPGSSPL